MEGQTVTWLVFLALIKHVSTSDPRNPFKVEPGGLPATEGSCIEIKCQVTRDVDDHPAYWFWMKDRRWVESDKDPTSTVIYSTNILTRPVSPDFANRVKYIGSSSSRWMNSYSAGLKPLCSILICDLRTSDSGKYSLRIVGRDRWLSEEVTLNVEENRCPLTFEEPAVVVESGVVTLTCSTSSSCPSNPHIQDVTQIDRTQVTGSDQDKERTTFSFRASWEDDRREFSCQTQDNTDKYLIRNITVTVKYKPRKTSISVSGSSDNQVKVGRSLTLTCDTDANPAPKTYSWYRSKNQQTDSRLKTTNRRMLSLTIQRADEACYRCSSSNLIGRGDKSEPVCIQVLYPPTEPILSMSSEVTEGQTITISCTVESLPQSTLTLMRIDTNPQSLIITENNLYSRPINNLYHKINVTSADAGWYFCRAENTEGSKDSEQKEMVVKYPPTEPILSMRSKVTEGQTITVTCSVDSFPQSTLTLMRINTNPQSLIITENNVYSQTSNSLYHKINVTSADAGLYVCRAQNTEGTKDSEQQEVVVKYSPTNLKVQANPGLDVKENVSLTLSCSAESNPLVSSVTWRKTTDEREEIIQQTQTQTFTVNSTSPSDSGLYSCEATNDIGSGKSQPAEVKVRSTGDYLENLRFLVVALLLLMIISVIVVNLRYWRRSVQQGTTNTKSPSGFSNEPESLQDYENMSKATALAPTSPNLLDDHTSECKVELNFPQNEPENLQDCDDVGNPPARAPTSPNLLDNHTSEGEVELNFPQVRFTATPRRQTTNRDSSSSHQDES